MAPHECVHEDRWKSFDRAYATIEDMNKRMFHDNGTTSIQTSLVKGAERMARIETQYADLKASIGLLSVNIERYQKSAGAVAVNNALLEQQVKRFVAAATKEKAGITWGTMSIGPWKVTGFAATMASTVIALLLGATYIIRTQNTLVSNQQKIEQVLRVAADVRDTNDEDARKRDVRKEIGP
jgi:hypothetical protein